jgi:hypothetical protein
MSARAARNAVVLPARKRRKTARHPSARLRIVVAALIALVAGVGINLATRPRLTGDTAVIPPLESGAALNDWSDSAGHEALRSRRLNRLASECPTATANRRRAVLDSFSHWNDEVLRLVACRRIRAGITAEQLQASWGRPARVIPDLNAMLPIEQWDYGHRFVVVADGRVKSWQ